MKYKQYERRSFRGHVGPTDRQLPKQNAARRRPQVPKDEFPLDLDDGLTATPVDGSAPPEENDASCLIETLVTVKNDDQKEGSCKPLPPCMQELDHLLRRIRNNRSSMSLSKTALANPSSYHTNVLFACKNSIREWRSILRMHRDDLDESTLRATSQCIFELIQQSVQSGPLAGSKPGYFKRCGSETAKAVYIYLAEIVEDKTDALETLGLSDRQAHAIETWKTNAHKAASSYTLPSKSVLKKQRKLKKK